MQETQARIARCPGNPEILGPMRDTHPDLRLAPDVHGLVVLPDDGNTYSFKAAGPGQTPQLRESASAIVARREYIQAHDKSGGRSGC